MEDINGAYNCDLIDMLETIKSLYELPRPMEMKVNMQFTLTMFEDALDFEYDYLTQQLLITWYGKPNPAWKDNLIKLIRTYVDDNMKICFIKKGV
jgi:hypothetical protein